MYDYLPGGEILSHGLRDLQAGVRSADAVLVLVAAPRLARCGIQIPQIGSGLQLIFRSPCLILESRSLFFPFGSLALVSGPILGRWDLKFRLQTLLLRSGAYFFVRGLIFPFPALFLSS